MRYPKNNFAHICSFKKNKITKMYSDYVDFLFDIFVLSYFV